MTGHEPRHYISQKHSVHLTWNSKGGPVKRTVVYKGSPVRFHVSYSQYYVDFKDMKVGHRLLYDIGYFMGTILIAL